MAHGCGLRLDLNLLPRPFFKSRLLAFVGCFFFGKKSRPPPFPFM